MPKKISAAEQFAALGITDAADYTPAMSLAVKQKWSGLPVTSTADSLRSQIAAVPTVPPLAVFAGVVAGELGLAVDDDAVVLEATRRKRNAGVNAWRQRGQLQAALDARTIKFARMRAGKKGLASQADQVAPATEDAAS